MKRALLALFLAMSPACAAACAGGGAACDREPGRPVTVFLDGGRRDARVVTLSGVTFHSPPEAATVPRHLVSDAQGQGHRLAFDDASGPLPVAAGQTYELTVEYVMGEPAPCALVLSDARGLLVVAASDIDVGRSVLTKGIPGFEVRLFPSSCRSRSTTKCYKSRVNAILEVAHGGEKVRLHHGESARLGPYLVTCHIAERVEYAPRCADAGVLGVSYTIRRDPR